MSKRVTLTGLVIAALAVPAVVIAGGGGSPGEAGLANWHTLLTNDQTIEAPRDWRRIPGLRYNGGPGSGFYNPVLGVTVSADMATGRARVRVVDEVNDDIADPGAVRFRPGSQSFTFLVPASTDTNRISAEWKRVGGGPTRARAVSMDLVGEID